MRDPRIHHDRVCRITENQTVRQKAGVRNLDFHADSEIRRWLTKNDCNKRINSAVGSVIAFSISSIRTQS